MKFNPLIAAAAAALTMSVLAPNATLAQNYSARGLGRLGSSAPVIAAAVNKAGTVVGEAQDYDALGSSFPRAFLDRNGVKTELPPLPGHIGCGAKAISASEQIAGYAWTGAVNAFAQPLAHAVIWQNGGITDLGTLGDDANSGAAGINGSGQVVGTSDGVDARGYATHHAFLWDGATGMHAIGPAGANSSASAINGSGQVAGWTSGADGVRHPYRWTPTAPNGTSGSIVILDTRAGYANSINDAGTVVGATTDATGSPLATLWDTAAAAHDLSAAFGGSWSDALGINNSSQIVGYSAYSQAPAPDGTGGGDYYTAIVWDSPLGARALNRLVTAGDYVGNLAQSVALSDAGHIAAKDDGATSFLLSPTDAPPAPSLFIPTAGDGQVALSWSPSTGAASYNVKRSSDNGQTYTTVAAGITSTTYTDRTVTNGTTYYYVVSAVSSTGREGYNSSPANATPTGVVKAPSGLTATGGKAKVTLKWTQSSSANLTQNRVYRSSTSGGTFVLRASIAPGTTFTDTSLASGLTYFYAVTAVNSSGHESPYSNQASAKVQ